MPVPYTKREHRLLQKYIYIQLFDLLYWCNNKNFYIQEQQQQQLSDGIPIMFSEDDKTVKNNVTQPNEKLNVTHNFIAANSIFTRNLTPQASKEIHKKKMSVIVRCNYPGHANN